MKNYTFLDFIRDIGAHHCQLHDGQGLCKETPQPGIQASACLSPNSPISCFRDMTSYLYQHESYRLRDGWLGSMGNITTGTELIRRGV